MRRRLNSVLRCRRDSNKRVVVDHFITAAKRKQKRIIESDETRLSTDLHYNVRLRYCTFGFGAKRQSRDGMFVHRLSRAPRVLDYPRVPIICYAYHGRCDVYFTSLVLGDQHSPALNVYVLLLFAIYSRVQATSNAA